MHVKTQNSDIYDILPRKELTLVKNKQHS